MNFFMAKWSAAALMPLLMFAGSSWTQAQRDDFKTIRGKVARFTEAPKGEVDGLELSDGTVVHWPPHLEGKFTAIVQKDDRVEVIGRLETMPKGEKVFEASTITNLATKKSFTNDDEGPPPPPAKGKKGKERLAGPERTATGTVERFTKAPKGEVDGLELSDGTVVHWPPHLERNYTSLVKKGDRIRVVGREETKPKGEKVLEARNISNLESGTSDEAATALGTRGANDEIEQRLRAIEDKLDALLKRMK